MGTAQHTGTPVQSSLMRVLQLSEIRGCTDAPLHDLGTPCSYQEQGSTALLLICIIL